MFRRISALAVALTATSALVAPAGAVGTVGFNSNLVVNGSFEADGGPAAGHWLIAPSLTGWTGEPDIELQNNLEGNVAQDGQYQVELDTFYNSAMTQVIHATGLVQLSFWYSFRNGRPFTGQGLTYSLGSLSGSLLESQAPGTAVLDWQRFSAVVDLGSSGSATLRFAAIGESDMVGGLLDNVSVIAVPEPGSAALWLAGLAGAAGLAAQRRRRRGG